MKAWRPGAQTIPKAIFSNFKRLSLWSPEKHAMEPWSTAILSLGARSPLEYEALDTRSLRTLRGPHVGDLEILTKHDLCSSLRGVSPLSLSNKNPVRLLGKHMFWRKINESTLKIPLLSQKFYAFWKRNTTLRRSFSKEK